MIIGLSTLPYFHDIITDPNGLKEWVPNFGLENLLTDSNGYILGFSSYRVFLYTFLIFLFATIGWAGWYQSAKDRVYCHGLLLVLLSGLYQLALILLNLRRTFWNEPTQKLIMLFVFALVLGYFSMKKHGINLRNVLLLAPLFLIAVLPFYHDVLTERSGELRIWVPNLGMETMMTDSDGYVRGLGNYRILVYLFCTYLFAHLGWIGWFFDSKGSRFRPFLLVPSALSLYHVVMIVMSWRETEFNSPSIKLYITLVLSVLLAFKFYYNNKIPPKTEVLTENKDVGAL